MIPTLLISIIALYAVVMLLFSVGFILTGKKKRNQHGHTSVSLSVVIPFRNESGRLPFLLEALKHQTMDPATFEVILVDDFSTDDTSTLIQNPEVNYPLLYLNLRDTGGMPGKKSAITLGARKARHPYILVTDADCLPDKNWIASYNRMFAEDQYFFIAGLVKLKTTTHPVSAIEALDFYGLVATSAGAAKLGIPFMCNGANMAFNKEVFLSTGSFDKHMHISSGDDVFLLHHFTKHAGLASIGWNLAMDGIVTTSVTGSFAAFLRQRVRWASKSRFYRNPTAIGIAILVLLANLSVIGGLALSIVSKDLSWAIWLYAIKSAGDFPLLAIMTKKYGQSKLLLWFIPTALLYPFYTSLTGIASFFARPHWKGRKIR